MTMSLPLYLLYYVLHLLTSTHAFVPYGGKQFERKTYDVGEGCYDFRWTFDRESYDVVMAATSTPGATWLGIGFSEYGSMKGADIAMIHWDEISEEFSIEDSFSHNFERPTKDLIQNYDLLYAQFDDDDRIQAIIRRKANTCDTDDLPITGVKQRVICASGEHDASGSSMYHGNQRGMTYEDIVIEKDLAFGRQLSFNSSGIKNQLVPDIVVAHDDPATATSPFPVDVVLPKMILDDTETTIYRCVAFIMPLDFRVISWEAVWGEGETVQGQQKIPSWLHHEDLRHCVNPATDLTPEQLKGQPFDCSQKMPCDLKISHARSPRSVLSAAHMPMEQGGVYVMLVHHENHYSQNLGDMRPGMRLWVEPPQLESTSSPAQMSIFGAHTESIIIPPDPIQRDHEIQFMISSEATHAVLPEDGVTVVANLMHMHLTGVRAHVSLIRDGAQIKIFQWKAYDFDMQSPQEGWWKILPGDALIVSCTYRPDPNVKVVGGEGFDNEMCVFGAMLLGETGSLQHGHGWAVRPNELFRKTYMGEETFPVPLYEDFQYEPNPEQRNFIPLKKYSFNTCDALVRHEINAHPFTWQDPAISAQIYSIAGFLAFCTTRWIVQRFKRDLGERKLRNTAIYIVQFIYSLIALPVVSIALANLFVPSDAFSANPNPWLMARAFIVGQAILFIAELFYRINIRFELVLHHILACGLVILVNWVGYEYLAWEICIKLGCLLTLFAVTEQINYLALILRNMGYSDRVWWKKLCYISAWIYLVSKFTVGGIFFYIVSQFVSGNEKSFDIKNYSFAAWMDPSVEIAPEFIIGLTGALVLLLLVLQIRVGIIFFKLAKIQKTGAHEKKTKGSCQESGDSVDDTSSELVAALDSDTDEYTI